MGCGPALGVQRNWCLTRLTHTIRPWLLPPSAGRWLLAIGTAGGHKGRHYSPGGQVAPVPVGVRRTMV